MGVEPRYDQLKISDNAIDNEFQQIVSPNPNDEGSWIHQDAWFHLGNFTEKSSRTYQVKKRRKWSLRFRYFRKCENR